MVELTVRPVVAISTGSHSPLPELTGLAEVWPWTNCQATDSHTLPGWLAIVSAVTARLPRGAAGALLRPARVYNLASLTM
jgi:hypothetical protein